jgi:hypothetical protein
MFVGYLLRTSFYSTSTTFMERICDVVANDNVNRQLIWFVLFYLFWTKQDRTFFSLSDFRNWKRNLGLVPFIGEFVFIHIEKFGFITEYVTFIPVIFFKYIFEMFFNPSKFSQYRNLPPFFWSYNKLFIDRHTVRVGKKTAVFFSSSEDEILEPKIFWKDSYYVKVLLY